MSTDTNKSFAHALIRDLLNERVPIGRIADHIEASFDAIHQETRLPEIQSEINAHQELCALRERLHRAEAITLATAKLVRILELPEPKPTGHIARDDRARYQHATLMLRTIDKLDRRTKAASHATSHPASRATSSRAQAHPSADVHVPTPPPCEPEGGTGEEHPVPSGPGHRTLQSSVPTGSVDTSLQSSVMAPSAASDTHATTHHAHAIEPAHVPPAPSEPAERTAEQRPAPAGSTGTSLQSNLLADPHVIDHLTALSATTDPHADLCTDTAPFTDTPPHTPSLARAG